MTHRTYTRLLCLLLLFLVPILSGQTFSPSYLIGTTVSHLPPASIAANQVWLVKDGTNGTDCTVGGGTTVVQCLSNGSAWSEFSGSSSGGAVITKVFDVTQYGPTGTADDTATLVAARLALTTAGGGVLLIPNGTYINTGLDGAANATYICQSWGAILKLKAHTIANVIGGLDQYQGGTAYPNFVVQGCQTDGNKTNQNVGEGGAGIALHGTNNRAIGNYAHDNTSYNISWGSNTTITGGVISNNTGGNPGNANFQGCFATTSGTDFEVNDNICTCTDAQSGFLVDAEPNAGFTTPQRGTMKGNIGKACGGIHLSGIHGTGVDGAGTTISVTGTNAFSSTAVDFNSLGIVLGDQVCTANFTAGANNGCYLVSAVAGGSPSTVTVTKVDGSAPGLTNETGTGDELLMAGIKQITIDSNIVDNIAGSGGQDSPLQLRYATQVTVTEGTYTGPAATNPTLDFQNSSRVNVSKAVVNQRVTSQSTYPNGVAVRLLDSSAIVLEGVIVNAPTATSAEGVKETHNLVAGVIGGTSPDFNRFRWNTFTNITTPYTRLGGNDQTWESDGTNYLKFTLGNTAKYTMDTNGVTLPGTGGFKTSRGQFQDETPFAAGQTNLASTSGGLAVGTTTAANITYYLNNVAIWRMTQSNNVFGTVTDGTGDIGASGAARPNRAFIKTSITTGGVFFGIVTKTANYTLVEGDYTVLGDTTSGSFTLTLPSAVGIVGQTYVAKKIASANTLTLQTTSSQTIDGATSIAITTLNQSYTVQSDGANWRIL